jgi:serine/threonine protein kinase
MTNPARSRLGRYELLARIATGGMGEIFLARLEGAGGFEKLYVIKRILPHLADDQRFRAMLIAEARVAANMSHANVCHVYELDESDGHLYIVMEYLEGLTLLAVLKKYAAEDRQLELGFVGGVVQQVAAGLHYAHELRDRDGELMGIVHRDVTPSNIFLTETGVAKVHDFGVAKAKDSTNTESGTVKGKFAYMAPEQLQGVVVDRRADVFAFGVVIAEMLTGRRLFQRKTDYLTFRAVMEQPLPNLQQVRPDLPEALIAVVTRALARNPEERYPSVRALELAVLDVIKRPWSPTEIGELIRRDFQDELARRHQEISGVVSRSRSSVRSMPIILQNLSDPDAEDYLAFETSVETGLESAPAPLSGSALSAPNTRVRSSWRPVAMVVGGAAAVLVIGLLAIAVLRPAAQAVAADPPARPAAPAAPVIARPAEPYGDAIRARDPELAKCAAAHAEAFPEGTTAVVRIGPDGRARRISFAPDEVERSPLGACLRDVFTAVSFPPATAEKELALAVRRR